MEEQMIKRILPHSTEAEQSVIGAMLLDQEAIITASEILVAEDFYNQNTISCHDRSVSGRQAGRSGYSAE